MILSVALLILGLVIILIAANALTDGAVCIACRHQISPTVIGLTIVAFGTSAPEIIVSIMAAINHKTALALGNVVGSNIANIGLVLGLTAIARPPKLKLNQLKKEYSLLFILMFLSYLLIVDGYLGFVDGLLLLLCLALLLGFLYFKAQARTIQGQLSSDISYPWLKIILGLIFLPISAQMIVNASIAIAQYFGVSELVIGLTIVALGTSLPEVATSVVATLKGHSELALANVIGSNMFNLVAVLPFVALIHPDAVPQSMLIRDMPAMFLISTVLLVLCLFSRQKLWRLQGALLLFLYVVYLVTLVATA